ncbi:MAG: N-methyl-L-tryptophan oxidase [Acidimicrobiales bacterium]|nr:N-methyl-L-tryptophan oxidase [Acidimicrobiales bacterium]MCB9392181.1 N-methyl-L-tryptophan oxidase [Acidimicrobiaceae bacterium]
MSTTGETVTADVVVVGLGGLGSASAYWLARAGVSVVGLEQFELGHVRGASHDHSRIIRRSYHTPTYVELTAGAYDAWTEVERDSGQQVITRTGGIDLFPADAAIDPTTYRESLDAVGVPHEWLDAGEVRRRWPAFDRGTMVAGDVHALFSAETGIVPAGPGTALLQRMAVEHGARLIDRSPVRSIDPSGGEVVIVADGLTVRAGAVIVCADAWTNRLLAPLGHRVSMAVTREQVSYFPTADRDDLAVGRFPVWIWMDDPSFYGFPLFGPPDVVERLKGSEDCGGPEVDPDTRTFEPDLAMEQRLGRFMADLLGDRFGVPSTTTCLYTLTADRDFVVDRLPDHPHVCVGLGAAHGFKFASWFGRTLAELARGTTPGPELADFAIDRPALTAPPDRRAWLV